MKPVEFNDFILSFDATCASILTDASKEYSSEVDRLDNFKRLGAMVGITPYQVACVFLLKHIDSITRNVSIREPMMGRFQDAANYIKLLAALHSEETELPTISRDVTQISSPRWTKQTPADQIRTAREESRGYEHLAQDLLKRQG